MGRSVSAFGVETCLLSGDHIKPFRRNPDECELQQIADFLERHSNYQNPQAYMCESTYTTGVDD